MKDFELFVLFFRLTGWVLLKLFNSFFWNIQIHRGQIEMVKAATEVRGMGKYLVRQILDGVSFLLVFTFIALSVLRRVLLSLHGSIV